MNSNSLVSIIVPAFNSQNTIKKCIESIINQNYKNIEIIIVNDGSKDNTKIICEKIVKNKDNVKLINIDNKGVANARNIGIANSSGEYIMFVDSDDHILPNYIEIMVNNLKDNSIVVCGINYISNFNIIKLLDIKSYNGCEYLKKVEYLLENNFFNSLCNKIYFKKIIDDNNIRFNLKYQNGEDLLFNIEYFKYINNVIFTNDCYYNYIDNTFGISSDYKHKEFFNQVYLVEKLKELFDVMNYDSKFILKKYMLVYRDALSADFFTINDKRNQINLIHSYIDYLKESNILKIENIVSLNGELRLLFRYSLKNNYYKIYKYIKIRNKIKKIKRSLHLH
ncbi:MAG: glycosyltransferase family 2 protein [Clostridia bacterium]|nr:glycosyltransferase family 2 protein [Clostridia bacterium]